LKSSFIKFCLIPFIAVVVLSIFLPINSFAAPVSLFLADVSVIKAKCKTQEDFAREFEIKKLATEKQTESLPKSQGYYYLAVLRYSQMQSLKSSDALKSARQYVAVNALYYTQALDYLNQSLTLDPLQDETGIHFLKLLIYRQLHNEETAGIEFSRLRNSISDIKDEAKRLQAYENINKLLMQYDCNEYALEFYGAYFEYLADVSSPDVSAQVLSAADLLLEQKSYLQAYQLHRQYLSLIKDEKKQQQEALAVADKYFTAKSYQEAGLFYESYLLDATELKDYALFRKAQSYDEANQIDKSITFFEELIETYPDTEYYVLSLEALENGYLDKSDFYNLSEIYKKMIDVYSDDSYKKEDAFYQLGCTLFLDEDYQESKEAFVEFMNQYPDSNYAEACQRYLQRIEEIAEDSNGKD